MVGVGYLIWRTYVVVLCYQILRRRTLDLDIDTNSSYPTDAKFQIQSLG